MKKKYRTGMEQIVRLKQGDESTYEQFVREKKRMLYSIAYTILLNQEDALDAIQDAFVRFYSYRHSLRDNENPDGYLIRILKNCCFDILKKNRKHLADELDDSHPDKSTPRETVIDIKTAMRTAMKSLGDKERLVLSLIHTKGFSSKEAADIMGISRSTVRTHYMNARKKLREIISKRYPELAR